MGVRGTPALAVRPGRHAPAGSRRHGTAGARRLTVGLAAGVVALVAVGGVVVVTAGRWPDDARTVLFAAWFVGAVAWADVVQSRLVWQVAVPLGAFFVLTGAVLPVTVVPPDDATGLLAAGLGALGLGLALGPAVAAVERLVERRAGRRAGRHR